MRALVIDDSRTMRTIIGRILKNLGFDVNTAGNGKEALAEMKDRLPTVALVDWNMPVMNGYEFIKAVRSIRAYDGVKLMMVTTEAELSQCMKALDAGADEYLMKPFNKAAMFEKLQLLALV